MAQEQRTRPISQAPASALPAVPGTPAGGGQDGGQVRLVAGADVQDVALAGRTVAEARTIAQALFGIHPEARALVDGHEVGEQHVLGTAQRLEFTRRAGQKGGDGTTIEIEGSRARWTRAGAAPCETTVAGLLERIAATGPAPEHWLVHPPHVRLMVERPRHGAVGLVAEMAPGPRRVGWVSDDSPAPFGPGSRIEERELSFPWVVLAVVFVRGELCGMQQAFYRRAPIESLDDPLLLTNLLNVTRRYGLESAVCFDNIDRRLRRLGWTDRVAAACAHFWDAAFTRLGEVGQESSYWATSAEIDPRVASVAAWEAATRDHPYFALDVGWRASKHTVRSALVSMLDQVAPWRRIQQAEQLATLMQAED